jgi:rare lipoprotein A
VIFSRTSGIPRPFLSFLYFLCFFSLMGCASRRPVVDQRHPAPARPAPAAADRVEKAKRDTDVEAPTPGTMAPAPPTGTASRSKPGAAAVLDGRVEVGNASWYGVPFHGRRASNGEIYDMNRMTAAHRTLPFDTMVRVTNLTNGKSAWVRITDRGPFVENRIIDLSLAAARELEMVAAGVASVRVEILSGPDPASGFFSVQVGAFLDRVNAERLRDRLRASYSPIFIQPFDSPDGTFYRVRVGRIATEDAARQLGDTLRAGEGFTPFVVRLDEPTTGGGNQ